MHEQDINSLNLSIFYVVNEKCPSDLGCESSTLQNSLVLWRDIWKRISHPEAYMVKRDLSAMSLQLL